MNFLAPLDARTLLYVARAEDWSGPWLWALDVETQGDAPGDLGPRAIHVGVGQPRRPARRRHRRQPQASLWRVPLLDRPAEDRDVQPYPLPTRAGAGAALRRDVAVLSVRPRDGRRALAVPGRTGVRSLEGRGRRVVRAARGVAGRTAAWPSSSDKRGNGTCRSCRRTARTHERWPPSIDIQGAAGQGTRDWSPDGAWIVTGGSDAQGPGLFKIPVDGGAPVRLVAGQAVNPVWSPDGNLIVYAGPVVGGQVALLGVRPDGTPVELPHVRVRPGRLSLPAQRNGPGVPAAHSVAGLLAARSRHEDDSPAHPASAIRASSSTFDITPDGKAIVFDRSRENSDIVLIDLPK